MGVQYCQLRKLEVQEGSGQLNPWKTLRPFSIRRITGLSWRLIVTNDSIPTNIIRGLVLVMLLAFGFLLAMGVVRSQ